MKNGRFIELNHSFVSRVCYHRCQVLSPFLRRHVHLSLGWLAFPFLVEQRASTTLRYGNPFERRLRFEPKALTFITSLCRDSAACRDTCSCHSRMQTSTQQQLITGTARISAGLWVQSPSVMEFDKALCLPPCFRFLVSVCWKLNGS